MINFFGNGISPEASNNENFETLQNARQDLVDEIKAIIEYDNHIHSTNNTLASKIWTHIKREELHHVGELLGLLDYLEPSQKEYVMDGLKEFMEAKSK